MFHSCTIESAARIDVITNTFATMTYGTKISGEQRLLPSPKRPRLETTGKSDEIPQELVYCQYLLATSEEHPIPTLPSSLFESGPTRYDLGKLKAILDDHNFRTSVVSSPREALSVYKDSCVLPVDSLATCNGKTWLVTLLGLHPKQDKLERMYRASIKDVYCLMLFCRRIRDACPLALQDAGIADLVSGCELQCRSLGRMTTQAFPSTQIMQHAQVLSSSVSRLVATLIRRVVRAEPRHRAEQLEREFERISLLNSTLSNAMLSLFLQWHECQIKEILYKRSSLPQYERLTVFLYDPKVDYNQPTQFLFMPSVRTILTQGPEALAEQMVLSFWSHLLRHGYFATSAINERLSVGLKDFFLSGISSGPHIPIHL